MEIAYRIGQKPLSKCIKASRIAIGNIPTIIHPAGYEIAIGRMGEMALPASLAATPFDCEAR